MVMGQLREERVIPAVTLLAPGVAFMARRPFSRSVREQFGRSIGRNG
jgi:hypothetical protein